jgi:hypothetical protein
MRAVSCLSLHSTVPVNTTIPAWQGGRCHIKYESPRTHSMNPSDVHAG